MANRYTYTNIKRDSDTKRQYMESTIYPKIKPNENDIYIIAEDMDKLDTLAFKYYGDARYWWVIATANNINDATLYIEPGRQIRIPYRVSDVLVAIQDINNK